MKVIKRRLRDRDEMFDCAGLSKRPVYPDSFTKDLHDNVLALWVYGVLEANLRLAAGGDDDAFDWVHNSADHNPLSFINCCKLLGYDPGRLQDTFHDQLTASQDIGRNRGRES